MKMFINRKSHRKFRVALFFTLIIIGLLSIAAAEISTVEEGETPATTAEATEQPVYFIKVKKVINPATADFIVESVKKANADMAECLVVMLDTPGGLLESTRDIVQSFFSSGVPVVVYVAPSGARAGSAGVFITMAGHVAAMAPGTNIGAAHPVGGSGEDIKGDMRKKVENDAVAQIKS